jgi:ParB family chromosome partitioning protein
MDLAPAAWSSNPMTKAVLSSHTPLQPIKIRLGDLGLARENLRFEEPADDGVEQLADTILAAGLLIPIIVRAGQKSEAPYMALDGRRRRFALLQLEDRGAITDDYLVDGLLAADKPSQAAAVLLPNTERAPVHVADVILAIGKMRKARMDTASISKALGYSQTEVKRLEALASLDPLVIQALREGRLSLRQARLFARLPSLDAQAEFAKSALDGQFYDYQLRQVMEAGRVTVEDARLVLVGLDRYLAAGGRTDSDLFGEMPDAVLDVDILERLWRDSVQPIIEHFKSQDLAVYLGPEGAYRAPEGFDALPYVYARELDEHRMCALQTAKALLTERVEALGQYDASSAEAFAQLLGVLEAEHAAAAAPLQATELGAVVLAPSPDRGIQARFYAKPAQTVDLGDDVEDDEADQILPDRRNPPKPAPEIEIPPMSVDIEGASHVLHETRTDVATRGLIRDLADNPDTALTVLVAQLFKAVVLAGQGGATDSATAISASGYRWGNAPPLPALDGEVRSRLEVQKAAYKASGHRPIAFVTSLDSQDRLGLMAELVAVTLNLRETRTTLIRKAARAEAMEIAALCGSDISSYWTPDEAFLSAHSKPQLLKLLAQMGVEDDVSAGLKKDALVKRVARIAADIGWAPPSLSWRPEVAQDASLEAEGSQEEAVCTPEDQEDALPTSQAA